MTYCCVSATGGGGVVVCVAAGSGTTPEPRRATPLCSHISSSQISRSTQCLELGVATHQVCASRNRKKLEEVCFFIPKQRCSALRRNNSERRIRECYASYFQAGSRKIPIFYDSLLQSCSIERGGEYEM